MSKSKTNIIVFCVTFVYFFIEALIHYNIGKNGEKFVRIELQAKTQKEQTIVSEVLVVLE